MLHGIIPDPRRGLQALWHNLGVKAVPHKGVRVLYDRIRMRHAGEPTRTCLGRRVSAMLDEDPRNLYMAFL